MLLWNFALQKDWIVGTASCGVTLVHDGVLTVGSPHPTRLRRPTFPLGEGSATQSLPLGGRWLRSRRMRATSRNRAVVYQANTVSSGTTDKILWQSQTPHTKAPELSLRRLSFCSVVVMSLTGGGASAPSALCGASSEGSIPNPRSRAPRSRSGSIW